MDTPHATQKSGASTLKNRKNTMQIQNIMGVWYVMDRKNLLITRSKTLEKALEQALIKYMYVYR